VGDPGSGDGRLELDDLGSVIDRAASLDLPVAETLEGAAGTSWVERLEDAGIAPWVRRHRVLVWVVTLLLVGVGVGGTAYRTTRPVPDDGVVAATATDGNPGSGPPTASTGHLLSFTYAVTPARSHDTLALLGLVGPGVRATSATDNVPASPGRPVRGDVFVVPECSDPRLVTAKGTDYRIQVVRVDAHGNTAIGLVDVPPGSDAQWPQTLAQACAQEWLDEGLHTESVAISRGPGSDELTLAVGLRNTLASQVAVDFTRYGGSLQSDNGFATLEPGSLTTVPVTFRVVDCTDPRFEFGLPGPDGSPMRGLSLTATLLGQSVEGQPPGAQQGVPLSGAQLDRVDTLISGVCAGAPRVSTRVLAAARTTNEALTNGLEANGNTDVVVLRLRLRVSTAGRSVTVGDTLSRGEILVGTQPTITTGSGPVVGGAAVVSLDWGLSCSSGANPPVVAVAVETAHRVYPVRSTIDDPVLARAVLHACPQLDPTQLAGLQWTSLGGTPDAVSASGGSGPSSTLIVTPDASSSSSP
jgi:hypothetical protein